MVMFPSYKWCFQVNTCFQVNNVSKLCFQVNYYHEVDGMKWPRWSDWYEMTLVLNVLVWSERYKVTEMKWMEWGELGTKCHLVWSDLYMKCPMVWSTLVWSATWYEVHLYEVPHGMKCTSMKWLVWGDFGMKWTLYEVPHGMKCTYMKWLVWSDIFSLWYEVTQKMKWRLDEVTGNREFSFQILKVLHWGKWKYISRFSYLTKFLFSSKPKCWFSLRKPPKKWISPL